MPPRPFKISRQTHLDALDAAFAKGREEGFRFGKANAVRPSEAEMVSLRAFVRAMCFDQTDNVPILIACAIERPVYGSLNANWIGSGHARRLAELLERFENEERIRRAS